MKPNWIENGSAWLEEHLDTIFEYKEGDYKRAIIIDKPRFVKACKKLLRKEKEMKTYIEEEVNNIVQRSIKQQEEAVTKAYQSCDETLQRLKEENEKLKDLKDKALKKWSFLAKRDKSKFKMSSKKKAKIVSLLSAAGVILPVALTEDGRRMQQSMFSLIHAVQLITKHLNKGNLYEG